MLDIPDPEKLAQAFTEMLENFSKMMEVDVDGLEPTTHALAQGNRLRADVQRGTDESETALERAPERQNRFFKIPNVL
ncbi:MAG: Asp-tRNA(Asn)/Glu-tRNA(Gln) amidotransferase subunit GatC [Deltaproteobacteria bacterium]|nr:Asp-tRNA(Asn)/Glu-tRNA(Gln) amidotransferase subunit GatC [Deltaproteobacteria bacterium]